MFDCDRSMGFVGVWERYKCRKLIATLGRRAHRCNVLARQQNRAAACESNHLRELDELLQFQGGRESSPCSEIRPG